MRISDWSSDVCSSDLWPCLRGGVCGKQDPDRSSRRSWKGRFRLRSRLLMKPGPESGPGRGDDCSVPRGGVDLLAGLEDRVVGVAMHVEESDQTLLRTGQ